MASEETLVIPSALVVDDHLEMAQMIGRKLADDGWTARVAGSGRAALAAMAEIAPDVVITDLRMPDVDGYAVLESARHTSAVIVMSAFGDVDAAVDVMRRGAWHYLAKPLKLADLVQHARRAFEARHPTSVHGMIGESAAMRALDTAIGRVAAAAVPVLIRGESGTGKELIARAIHANGPRATGPFLALNCAALPEALVEAELFGHARGAFTGAVTDRPGLFRAAHGGTLFLDEIGDMPLATQAKLLRVLQDRELRAVGSTAVQSVDVRVIAATHRDLPQRVAAGEFRQDLYYRLAVLPIAVPPLRERGDDIALLVDHFVARSGASLVLADDVRRALETHAWPGNVRELENVIGRLAILSAGGVVTMQDVRDLAPEVLARPTRAFDDERLRSLREVEDDYIAWVLAQCGSNKARAAEILGIDPSTLYRKARSATPSSAAPRGARTPAASSPPRETPDTSPATARACRA